MHTIRFMTGFISMAVLLTSLPTLASDMIRSIHVRGEGSVSSPPDMATVDTGVTQVANSAAQALELNNKTMAQLMGVLKEQGIAPKDIQTSNFNVGPEYAQRQQNMEIVGYRVSNQVRIRVRDLPNLGKLLDALVKSGSNQVSGIQFGIDDDRGVMDQARSRAVQEARRRADLYASAAGVRVGRVLSIEEQASVSHGPIMMRAMAADTESVPVASGEQTVQASIEVRYELID